MRWAILSAAPHRLYFLGGLIMLNLAMALWLATRSGVLPATISGLDHAILISHCVFGFFIFGFLITVFPRWLDRPAIPKAWYVAGFAGLVAGAGGMVAGLSISPEFIVVGLLCLGTGWLVAWSSLAHVLWRADKVVLHALVVLPAVLLGLVGLMAYGVWRAGGDWQWVFLAVQGSVWLFLAPVFLAVSHRMIPFFSEAALARYQQRYEMYRPALLLWVLVGGCFGHFALTALHRYEWLWLVDVPLGLIAGYLWLRWQPWRSRGVPLLRALFVAFAWFWIAAMMSAIQSAWYLLQGNFVFGRAPVHALTIGFFTTMAYAMVTRVSLGHSGRALKMSRLQWAGLLLLQLVALLRVAAEWPGITVEVSTGLVDASAWLWLGTLIPWAFYFGWICATPRIDSRPG